MKYGNFILKFTVVYVLTYLFFGIVFFSLITHSYYKEGGAFTGFLVSTSDEEKWKQIQIWMIPVQIFRSVLLGSVLFLIWKNIDKISFLKKFVFLWSFLGIVGGFASGLPSPGNLEGMLYMNQAITWKIHIEIFLEVIVQSALFSLIFTLWMKRDSDQ